MNSEQRAYIDCISKIPRDEILVKESGREIVALPLHSHPVHQLLHTISGTLHVWVDGVEYFVPEHHVAWIPAGVDHQLSSNNRQIALQIISGAAMHAKEEEFAVYTANGLMEENLRFLGRCGGRISRLAQPELYDFAVGFLNLIPAKGQPYRLPLRGLYAPADPRLREILRYIDTHISAPLSKEEIASSFGMSARNLSRLFQEADMRFSAYVNYQRITRAIELFADHDKTIEEVAYAVGFNSPNHFNRVFRQFMGQSPGYFYRKFSF